jgi:hypothetical protein
MSRIRLLSLLAVLGLLFAACGDDDDTTTAASDTTERTADDASDDDSDDDGLTDDEREELAGSLGDCGFLVGFAEAFADSDLDQAFTSGEAVDFGQLFGPMAAAMREVADAAPGEIKDAFQTVAEGFNAVADQLDGVVIDMSDPANMDPEAMAKLESMDTEFDEDFERASEEIEAWMEANCADFADAFDLDTFGR